MKKIVLFLCLLVYSMGMTVHSNDFGKSSPVDSVVFDSLAHKSVVLKNMQAQIDSLTLTMDTDNLKNDYVTKDKIINCFRKISVWIISAIIILLAVLIIVLYTIYRKLSKRVNEAETKTKDDHCRSEKEESDMVIQLVDKRIKPIKSEIKSEILKELNLTPDSNQESTSLSNVGGIQCEKLKDEYKDEYKIVYAKPMRNGCLKETLESTAQYVIRYHLSESKGAFKVYEGQEQMQKAIKNREDCLDLFCIANGSSVDATVIKTLTSGEVEREESGIWKVKKKAEIEFIK